MSEEVDQKEGIPLPIWVGVGLTVMLIGGAIWASFGAVCDNNGICYSRWQALQRSPSNEIGDTLSGIGSALAFIWLVITAWMQSQELRAQRMELRQQRKEWKKISAAQDAQVEILRTQGEIFADEQLSRRQQAAKEKFDKLLKSILSMLGQLHDFEMRAERYRPEQSLETNAHSILGVLVDIAEDNIVLEAPEQIPIFGQKLSEQAREIESCVVALSEDQKVRAHRLGVHLLRERIERMLSVAQEELQIVEE